MDFLFLQGSGDETFFPLTLEIQLLYKVDLSFGEKVSGNPDAHFQIPSRIYYPK